MNKSKARREAKALAKVGLAEQSFTARRRKVLEAVKKNGLEIIVVDPRNEFRYDREICLHAVKSNGWSLQCFSMTLRNDREVVSLAMSNDKEAFKFSSDEIKNDKQFIHSEIVKLNNQKYGENYLWDIIEHASEDIQKLCEDQDPIKALETAIAHDKLQSTLAQKQEQPKQLQRGFKL